MKYCSHCGAELVDDAVICTKCGCEIKSATPIASNQKKEKNACAIVGFILAVLSILTISRDWGAVALAGMIVSCVGLSQIVKNKEQGGRGLAIAGIAVGAFFFVYGFVESLTAILS